MVSEMWALALLCAVTTRLGDIPIGHAHEHPLAKGDNSGGGRVCANGPLLRSFVSKDRVHKGHVPVQAAHSRRLEGSAEAPRVLDQWEPWPSKSPYRSPLFWLGSNSLHGQHREQAPEFVRCPQLDNALSSRGVRPLFHSADARCCQPLPRQDHAQV